MTFLLAHAVPGIDYRFPLPVWLYGLAAGVAVLASAPAALVAVRSERTGAGRDLYARLRRWRLGAIGLALATLLFLFSLAGGLFGAQNFFENPATILIWVDFWVGLGIVSALVANIWDFVSPLSALGRRLERRLAVSGVSALPYPSWLGLWPATAMLLVWTWMELIWDPAKEPRTLALIAIAYVALQLLAMAAFGTEIWLARGEVFTVVARTFGRFAPIELYVRRPAGPCRAERCLGDERIGCSSCWLDADSHDRAVRLRAYASGIRHEPPLGVAGGSFVLALLATVVYDGLSQTNRYARLEGFFLDRSGWLAAHTKVLDTLLMAAVVAAFVICFLAVCAVVSLREPGGAAAVARRYAPTLIPIAAVYFVSHYFLYLIYAGQLTWGNIADPFGKDWVPDYSPWTGVPGAAVWYAQVALIVWGHVAAVLEAHRVSVPLHPRPRLAVLAQSPLVLLMVLYTFTGLWVLGQVLAAP